MARARWQAKAADSIDDANEVTLGPRAGVKARRSGARGGWRLTGECVLGAAGHDYGNAQPVAEPAELYAWRLESYHEEAESTTSCSGRGRRAGNTT